MNKMDSTFEPQGADTVAEGIAIVGMAGRFPGAAGPRQFWRNLREGVDSVTRFTAAELEDTFPPDVRRSPDYVPARPILHDVDQFDADFFGMYPREAMLTDPQQRVFLECCWEALEDAGYDPAAYKGLIGVFAGSSFNTYLLKHVCQDRAGIERFTSDYQVGSYQELMGSLADFVATRVCYRLDLRGPGVNVQSACSTSLVAVAQACQSLLLHQADMVLAGGVSITFPQKRGYVATEGAMVSPDGRCRPFDANASGTIFGSGAGVVLLKRLSEAIEDGDHIYAVIRGYGINNDGAAKAGFTAPSVDGQAEAIALAHAMAGVSAREIGYVECHGTATPLGDPIEFAGLLKAFRATTDDNGFCVLGSGKANVGHLDAAAGVTGLIKTALTLQHRQIPPLLHYVTPNPHIDLPSSPFTIINKPMDWPAGGGPRKAGVSAFGVGGTNVHVVLEEAPAAPRRPMHAGAQLIVLSARSAPALTAMSDNLAQRLVDEPGLDLADIAWTLQTGRRRFAHRKTVVAGDAQGAIAALKGESPERMQERAAPLPNAAVHFLFPGQGTQYVGMGAELYAREPRFREAFDSCAAILDQASAIDLHDLIFAADADPQRLRDTAIAQPAIFAIEYALARLWMSRGIEPKAMVGHSIGEFAAATIAGIFSLEDALRMVAARGRLMHDVPQGGMLSVGLSEEQVLARLPNSLCLAAVNAPQQTVVAGPLADIEAFAATLGAEKIKARRLVTSHAFHSRMMEPVVAAFREVVAATKRSPPRVPLLSTLTGTWLSDAEATDPDYWARHLRAPVRFSAAVSQLCADPAAVLLEVGPGTTLSFLARLHGVSADQVIVSSLPAPGSGEHEAHTLLTALGAIWLAGIEPDWRAVHGGETAQPRRLPLPSYPFERKRHWSEARAPAPEAPTAQELSSTSKTVSTDVAPMAYDSLPVTPAAANNAAKVEGTTRFARIREALVVAFADLSGTDLSNAPPQATFLELGFDSLFLTQATREVQNKLGVKITFRQLLSQLNSFDALARFADEKLPADAFPEPAAAPAAPIPSEQPAAVAAAASAAPALAPTALATLTALGSADAGTALERVIRDQLALMGQIFSGHLGALQAHAAPAMPALPALTQAPTLSPAPAPTQALTAVPAPAPTTAALTSPAASTASGEARFQPFGPYKPLQVARMSGVSGQQEAAIRAIIARYNKRTAKSKALTQAHRKPLADPRVVSGFRDNWKEVVYPIVTNRSKGSRLWDVDGNEYVDMLNGFGPIMFGHRPDFIERALEQQLHEGFEIGPQTPLAGEIAELFCAMTGNDRMTFCNTGSEAVMAALRVARTVTGRDKVLIFSGDYHGMFDEVLIKSARSKSGPAASPIAPGIPRESVANMVVMDYGTPETLEWIRNNADKLAAVLTEPIQSRRPGFKPVEFLRQVREITRKAGTALIFDEVVTGFRVHPGGCQALFGIRADMATYGKVLGGGMPIGVLAGSREYMDALDGGAWQFGDDSVPEVGVTFFAGTFVRHPLTLAAVKSILLELKAQGPALQERLTQRTAAMVARINAILERYQIPTRIDTSYSVMFFSFPPEEKLATFFYYLLREQGVHVLEGFPCFMTTAHSDADIDHIVGAFEKAAVEMRARDLFSGGEGVILPAHLPPMQAEPVPLTEPQREVFLAAMLGDDASCAFNESISTHFAGPLLVDTLRAAVNSVIARHDALRASIDPAGPSLDIAPELRLDLPLVDLTDLPVAEREPELQRLLAEDARTAFNLVEGPLMRGFVAKLDNDAHVLVLTMHHIVCDGWSCNVMLTEVAEHYSAAVEQRAPELEPVLSFSEFAIAQAGAARASEVEAAEAYWLDRFKTVPPLIELPTDRPRGAARTFAGASTRYSIAAQKRELFANLGRKHGASLFVTLFAGFNALLLRLTGQNDLVVAVPMAGQSLAEGGALVGHCVSFLPLRTTVPSEATFADLLGQVKDTLLDAYDHQQYTYGTLVQKLGLQREPSRLPLTELQFNLEQVASKVRFSGLESRTQANAKAAVNSDIFVNIVEQADGLVIECDYNTDLFDVATVNSWLAGLETLLVSAAANPTRPVAMLALPESIKAMPASSAPASLTAEDRERLAAWNATAADYRRNASIVELFEQQAARTPDGRALAQGDVALSYRELNARANRLAHHLRDQGAKPGTRVGICLDRTPDLVVALLAVLKSGAAYLPLDPTYPSDRVAFMLEDGQAALLVTQQRHANLVPQAAAARILIDGDRSAIDARPADNPVVPIEPSDLAYVIHTSGSTGKPKGVAVPHGALANFLNTMQREPGLASSDVLAAVTTISFDIAGLELYLPLVVGARIELVTRDAAVDGSQLARVLEASGATVLQATPATWRMLIEAGWQGNKSMRALCGGEALSRDLADILLARVGQLWNMYGPTETTIWSTVERIEPGAGAITIGRPIANTQVHVLDDTGEHAPIDVAGEIYIGGDGVAAGYIGRPDLTAERFVPDRFSSRADAKLYRTGDLGRWLPDGRLQHLGRIDHQVKIRGFRIELGEIEAVLQQAPGVKQTCVVADKGDEVAGRLVAFCIPSVPGSLVLDVILGHLKQKLPSYMIPASFVNVDRFPLTANGKLDKLQLLEIERQRRAERVQVAPQSPEEQTFVQIVKEVMRLEDIGVTDNLFEVGADSLRIFQIASRAAKAGLAVTPRAILQGRTIRGSLAQAAATSSAPGFSSSQIKPAARKRVKLTVPESVGASTTS